MTAYRSNLFASVAVLAIASTAQAQSPAPTQINFSVPAGPLGGALNAYARQAGRQLMFTSDQVAGRRTTGLSGRMTADAALDQLLAGSGLIAARSSSGAWVLQSASQPGLAAVTLDEVVVTGTLLRGPGDTPSPVTVIRRDDLDRTGRATVADALAALPQNYAGSGTPTAALVGSDPMQSNPGLATGVNLRGLGPDSTLVLVNGRRMAGAGGRGDFADVSAVPTAAVERVDVLLDGASALETLPVGETGVARARADRPEGDRPTCTSLASVSTIPSLPARKVGETGRSGGAAASPWRARGRRP